MAKKQPLTPDEVTELFSELDESGVLDPSRVSNREKRLKFRVAAQEAGDSESLGKLAKASGRSKTREAIDPLSGDDLRVPRSTPPFPAPRLASSL